MSEPETQRGGDTRNGQRRSAVRVAACISFAALVLAAFPALAAAITGPPIVETSPAVQVAGGFSLRGMVNPYGLDTHYHFEYGTTTAYGTSVPSPEADAGPGFYGVPVSETVTGLQPSTTYHFRLVASNSEGPGKGSDQSFTTPSELGALSPPGPETTGPYPGESSAGKGGTARVKTRRVGGRLILTAANGHTLYSLSAEKRGRLICTKRSGCLALWHPLLVSKDKKPQGPVTLGTIKRPEGGTQVTFHGRPLYSFAGDLKPGQAKGEGLKDVGTWHAVTVSQHKR